MSLFKLVIFSKYVAIVFDIKSCSIAGATGIKMLFNKFKLTPPIRPLLFELNKSIKVLL